MRFNCDFNGPTNLPLTVCVAHVGSYSLQKLLFARFVTTAVTLDTLQGVVSKTLLALSKLLIQFYVACPMLPQLLQISQKTNFMRLVKSAVTLLMLQGIVSKAWLH